MAIICTAAEIPLVAKDQTQLQSVRDLGKCVVQTSHPQGGKQGTEVLRDFSKVSQLVSGLGRRNLIHGLEFFCHLFNKSFLEQDSDLTPKEFII